MTNRSSDARSFARAFSVVLALGLAVLATIGATVEQRPEAGEAAAIAKTASVSMAQAHCGPEAGCCASACGGSAAASTDPVPFFCFDAKRPPRPEIMDWINSLHDTTGDFVLFNSFWGPGNGTQVTLTWSLVPDGTMLPGLTGQAASPSNLFSRMNQLFNNNQALWISVIEDSFNRWSELTGVTFVRVTHGGNEWDDGASFPGAPGSSSRGQFRVGMRPLDGAGGVLAFAYLPTTSDIVLDSSEGTWWSNSGGNYRRLRNVMMHEIGHGLGMAHCCPMNSSKLMEPAIVLGFDGPQHDDVRGLHVRYGDYYTPNSSIGSAADLGPLSTGQTLNPSAVPPPNFNIATSRTSIDRLADQDWFRFSISEPVNLNVTMTPVGYSYPSGQQLQSGQCSSGSTVNSLTMAALGIQVFGPNTTSLIATSDGNPAGQPEAITDLMLTEPGNYFVRVFANSSSGPQLYNLEIEGSSGPGTCPSFTLHPNNATLCAGAPIQFSAQATGSPAPTFQWRRNGVPIPGATSNVYAITSVSAAHAGSYDCIASNTCGDATSNAATLTVNVPPSITTHPLSQNVPVGTQVEFIAEADGAPSPFFRWYRNNQLISGGSNGTLVIQSASESDAGTYHAEAVNACGVAPTNQATLTVEPECYANCTGNTTPPLLTVDDFTCFINAFAAAQSLPIEEQITHYANCNGTTTPPILTVDDFTCFIDAFAQGCN